ncbi:MAG: tetratricopeptide repeat protein [Chloroflexota bacterium]|nr:tetratricopeptide repeat protein [Chloroflexota bacterium]
MTNSSSVVVTRVLVPQKRHGLLQRPRLLDFIRTHIERKLLLIVAPAGYGKTALLVDYAHDADLPVCWYSLSEFDQDLAIFVQYLLASLGQTFPNFAPRSEEVLKNLARTRQIEALVGMLVNDIYATIPDFFVLILDDHHLVNRNPVINQFLDALISQLPENCCVIIASREIPTLTPGGLALLAARQQVAGLGVQGLRFTAPEIQTLLRENYEQHLPDQAAEDLALRSEGWIAGILLTTHTLWKGLFREFAQAEGTGSQVFDYLTNEVFRHQEPDLQDFLLRSAVLDEMIPPLCDALLGIQGSARFLEQLEERNLFIIRLDKGIERWWRYHQLFRDFLLERLARTRPAELLSLHLRAADWWRAKSTWNQAIHHYLRAGAYVEAVQVIREIARATFTAGQLVRLAEWIDALPRPILGQNPLLLRYRAKVCSDLSEADRAIALFSEAARGFEEHGDRIGLANTLVDRSVTRRINGQWQESIQDCQKALGVLNSYPAECPSICAEAQRNIGICHAAQGRVTQGVAALKESLRLYEQTAQQYDIALVASDLGIAYRMAGNLSVSDWYLQRSVRMLGEIDAPGPIATVLNNVAVNHATRGEYATALETYQRALVKAEEGGAQRIKAFILLGRGDVFRETEEYAQALQNYMEGLHLAERCQEASLIIDLKDAIGNTYLLTRDVDQASHYVQQAITEAEARSMVLEQGLCLLSLAAISQARGDGASALRHLKEAQEILEAREAKRGLSLLWLLFAVAHEQQGNRARAFADLETVARLSHELGFDCYLLPYARRMLPLMKSAVKRGIGGRRLADLTARAAQKPSLAPPKVEEVTPTASTPVLSFFGLGKARVVRGNTPISPSEWGMVKARDLVFYLLCHPNATKEQIGLVFWPDLPPARLRSIFHVTMYRLRRALARMDCVIYEDDKYTFNREIPYWFDVDVFVMRLDQADILDRTDVEGAMALRREAVGLYNGVFMEDSTAESDEWVVVQREALSVRYENALCALGAYHEKCGEHADALERYRQALDKDSLNEVAHQGVMRCYARMGDRSAALKHYRDWEKVMREEFGEGPTLESVAVYQQILRGDKIARHK